MRSVRILLDNNKLQGLTSPTGFKSRSTKQRRGEAWSFVRVVFITTKRCSKPFNIPDPKLFHLYGNESSRPTTESSIRASTT
jgi:hypothetical protein